MVAIIQFIAEKIGLREKDTSPDRPGMTREIADGDESDHRIGEYHADYSQPSPDELAADPDMDDLIRRSRVVSEKRGL